MQSDIKSSASFMKQTWSYETKVVQKGTFFIFKGILEKKSASYYGE